MGVYHHTGRKVSHMSLYGEKSHALKIKWSLHAVHSFTSFEGMDPGRNTFTHILSRVGMDDEFRLATKMRFLIHVELLNT